MSFLMQCPLCDATIKLPETAQTATCPKCAKTFRAVRPEEAEAMAARQQAHGSAVPSQSCESDDEGDDSNDAQPIGAGILPAWIGVWGFFAFLMGGVGLLLAPILMVRWWTIAFAVVGLVSVGVGLAKRSKSPGPKEVGWLAAGGLLSLVILGMALFAPGLLNRFWGMADLDPAPDPHQLFAYSGQPDDKGRALGPEDLVDADRSAIGQDGVSLRIMSAHLGVVEGRDTKELLLLRVRFSNISRQRSVTFEGFGNDKNRPVLKGAAGEAYAFLEQRARKVPAGAVVFVAGPPQTVDIQPTRFLELQLVFEPPPEDFAAMTLELPASTWGRKGIFRYRIDRLFEPEVPLAKKN
jgi:hypothetical protein